MLAEKRWFSWGLPILLLALGAVIVILAPNEKTMGAGIKPVYVHVAFSWVGLVGIGLAALLAIVFLFRDSEKLYRWMEVASWLGLVWFFLGLLLSLPAAKINWGGIFLAEPRTAAGLKFTAIALIAKTLADWSPWKKLPALVNIALLGVLGMTTFSAELVLHPKDPIRTSTSLGIQGTFVAMFVVVLLLGIWAGMMVYRRMRPLS